MRYTDITNKSKDLVLDVLLCFKLKISYFYILSSFLGKHWSRLTLTLCMPGYQKILFIFNQLLMAGKNSKGSVSVKSTTLTTAISSTTAKKALQKLQNKGKNEFDELGDKTPGKIGDDIMGDLDNFIFKEESEPKEMMKIPDQLPVGPSKHIQKADRAEIQLDRPEIIQEQSRLKSNKVRISNLKEWVQQLPHQPQARPPAVVRDIMHSAFFAANGALRVGFMNAHGIKDKRSEIMDLIKKNSLDFFCIAETWLSVHENNTLFNNISSPALRQEIGKRGRGKGGVMIAFSDRVSKNDIVVKLRIDGYALLIGYNGINIAVVYLPLVLKRTRLRKKL